MSQNRPGSPSLTILACLAALLSAPPALACSVCYGDPNSAMTQGAQAGVLVLLGVIGMVLTAFASLLIFWIRRAANLEARRVGRMQLVLMGALASSERVGPAFGSAKEDPHGS